MPKKGGKGFIFYRLAAIVLALIWAVSPISSVSGPQFRVSASGIQDHFSITIDNISGGTESAPPNYYANPITLAGSVSANDFVGQIDQYHVEVDWGDGTIDPDSSPVLNKDPTSKNFAGIWKSYNHTYAASGTYTARVTLYHQKYSEIECSVAAAINVMVDTVKPVAGSESADVPDQAVGDESATISGSGTDRGVPAKG